jgi:hypothetical protein
MVMVDGFFGIDNSGSFCRGSSLPGGISFSAWLFLMVVWCCFSTESLILAQDERWRRA